ncbi:secretagogin-like isoform X2 [Acanthaster planci]|uniref:Secretagogin-like isoform X2 n=1 Tax=Acanthaster planci TaxID=133434 RepID=A0A8B7ZCQ5_ACAPL|nr:secretagogin-like isoform X2 [Acanthaster planci]
MADSGEKDACLAKFRVKCENLTADEFAEAWHKYDRDGNGYIEGNELEFFFRDFIDIESDECLQKAIATYMKIYDENNDNRIEMMELAEIMKPEQNFLLLFRSKEAPRTSKEFYDIWLQYDADRDGFIDKSELKNFLRDLSKVELSDEKLQTYTEAMIKLFDVDKDNKLSFKEMLKLVPVKENIFLQFESLLQGNIPDPSSHLLPTGSLGDKGKKLKVSSEEFKRVFKHYDKDQNNVISGEELSAFLKDLVILHAGSGPVVESTLDKIATDIMTTVDKDKDNVISENELKMFLGVTSDDA